jgi:hypothetical protein
MYLYLLLQKLTILNYGVLYIINCREEKACLLFYIKMVYHTGKKISKCDNREMSMQQKRTGEILLVRGLTESNSWCSVANGDGSNDMVYSLSSRRANNIEKTGC